MYTLCRQLCPLVVERRAGSCGTGRKVQRGVWWLTELRKRICSLDYPLITKDVKDANQKSDEVTHRASSVLVEFGAQYRGTLGAFWFPNLDALQTPILGFYGGYLT